jgi:hypothetical protein
MKHQDGKLWSKLILSITTLVLVDRYPSELAAFTLLAMFELSLDDGFGYTAMSERTGSDIIFSVVATDPLGTVAVFRCGRWITKLYIPLCFV